jgi:hypothetical protein
MSEAQYLVGVDLGTSNCAVAYVEPASGPDAPVEDFSIEQLHRPGQSAPGALLPSCIYLLGEHELPPESTRLPWGNESEVVVGEFARWQGGRVPDRLVSSAKSWLCHAGVDRSAPILPWGAPPEARKLSPVEASTRLLRHIVRAWNLAYPVAPLAEQEVVLTVPASFDEAARALTVEAAKQAGLAKFTLLEEPQAAFYDFTARHRHDLAQALEGVRLVLVVDVGGGTSDFTLVQVELGPDGPLLRRIAVGEHLMLGGDNMDAALSRKAEERMLSGGRRLSSTQWSQLTQAAREAKEALLATDAQSAVDTPGRPAPGVPASSGAPAPARQKSSEASGGKTDPGPYHLSVVAEGSRLVGGSLSTHISRPEIVQIILDGFFPECGPDETPQRGARVALQEMGLPYAQDPAITRHLAAFLRVHATGGFAAVGEPARHSSVPRPDAILLNGGVFNSPQIRERLVRAVSGWWPDQPPIPLLHHESLDLAVARGAAFYGLVRRGLGRRISGGAAHALYVGLEAAGSQPAALCVIPRGQEEGQTVDLRGRGFQLALGKPVRFPLFSTASDRLERAGEIVPVTEDLQPLPPIHTLLRGSGAKTGNTPVHLSATLTEIGTLELWCVSNNSPERWRLEFELRGTAPESTATVTESMSTSFEEARAWIGLIFAGKGPRPPAREIKGTPPKDVKQLWTSLERTLGPRDEWRLPVLRELWSTLFAGAMKRRRSSEHERIFFQLLGYSLRPGFGYALDEWRCEQTAHLFAESVQFHKEKPVWKEFWILWRRIAGGLSEARHQEFWSYLKPHLALRIPPKVPKHLPRPKGLQPEGLDEMVRLAGALEHLPPGQKVELGDWIVARLGQSSSPAGGPWTWALGRLGTRTPIYGSVHNVLPPAKAGEWAEFLLTLGGMQLEAALFALAQLARLTGDRVRDLEPELRARVLEVLRAADASPSWQRMVAEVVAMEAADKARALGDTLPVGLALG